MSGWAGTLFATSLLMALVLVVRRPVARQFGAAAAYALWLAPLARLLLPALPAPVDPPAMWIETSSAIGKIASAASPATGVSLAPLLLGIWLSGAGIFLLWHAIAYRRFLSSALADACPVAEPSVTDAAVLETPAVSGPAATGLLVRRIFVPRGFAARFGEEERCLALEHEALHHRRGDLWASAAALLVFALHWWNPLAHAAHRAFRRDLEAACDASLIAATGETKREAYANTILRCVAQPMPHPTCALTNLAELKGRLHMLTLNHGPTRRRAGLAIATCLTAAGLFVALPAIAQETPPPAAGPAKETVEVRKIISHGEGAPGDRERVDIEARMKDCPNAEKFEADGGTDGKTQKTRIVICQKPGGSRGDLAKQLEQALGRIEGTDEMPAGNKAAIVAQLKARIAALRSAN
jgi:bla regulator protein blaR1